MAAGTGGKFPAWFDASNGKHGQSGSGLAQGGPANSAAQSGIGAQEWRSLGYYHFSADARCELAAPVGLSQGFCYPHSGA